ncbi:hypothetical protein NPIL_480791 [Nephila pilipes]|uniref:Uncharacterized protein n=1 Tax=Nephila pilipes TaxID=299642 RepID=A0A8X6M9E4_NEPPI|nr:hypothetical protein NPIL_480791 [Nephila pilipes]
MFVRNPFEIQIEELLMSEELKTYAAGNENLKAIDKRIQKNDLKWSKCVNICCDRAAGTIGKVKGAVSRRKKVTGMSSATIVQSVPILWQKEN